MLPEAPPTAWAATIVSGDSTPGRFTPVAYWNWENMRLETVFDPATNAPSAPTNGATSGHALPTEFAAASASTSGMESIPDELWAAPELMNTRTIGTEHSRANAAPAICMAAALHAPESGPPVIRCGGAVS